MKQIDETKINFNKIEIENKLLKFENGFLKSENERLNNEIYKIFQDYTQSFTIPVSKKNKFIKIIIK